MYTEPASVRENERERDQFSALRNSIRISMQSLQIIKYYLQKLKKLRTNSLKILDCPRITEGCLEKVPTEFR